MFKHFAPRHGRFGVIPVVVTFPFGASPFTASATVRYQIPTPPGELIYSRASVQCEVVGISASGSLFVRVFRRRASDDVRTQLTADFNVEALVTRERRQLALASGVTDAQRVVNDPGASGNGDTIEVDLVSDAAIGTQPTQLVIAVELFYLR